MRNDNFFAIIRILEQNQSRTYFDADLVAIQTVWSLYESQTVVCKKYLSGYNPSLPRASDYSLYFQVFVRLQFFTAKWQWQCWSNKPLLPLPSHCHTDWGEYYEQSGVSVMIIKSRSYILEKVTRPAWCQVDIDPPEEAADGLSREQLERLGLHLCPTLT